MRAAQRAPLGRVGCPWQIRSIITVTTDSWKGEAVRTLNYWHQAVAVEPSRNGRVSPPALPMTQILNKAVVGVLPQDGVWLPCAGPSWPA